MEATIMTITIIALSLGILCNTIHCNILSKQLDNVEDYTIKLADLQLKTLDVVYEAMAKYQKEINELKGNKDNE